MARFRASVSGAAPLQIQLTTPSTGWLEVHEVAAKGENALGAASRPVLSRPSVPGTGSGVAVPLDGKSTATATVVTLFSTAPTPPITTSGPFNLPIREHWAAMGGKGFIVGFSSSILLYAAASGGYLWSGDIVWEEF